MTNPENEQSIRAMSSAPTDTTEDELTVEQWLEIRKQAGLRIDPETAEVVWVYARTLDPYGVYSESDYAAFPEGFSQVGREQFARSPGSDIWVWFLDLPGATRERLWELHSSDLLFPAGLFETDEHRDQ